MTAAAPELVRPPDTSHLTYRPAIDGLRAVAVLSVFVFHLNRNWLPGGFVGVDIFFVISGYLITSIIHKDCLEGTFSLARFYQRRIARIFPAFFTVALATLAAASLIYTPQDLAFAGLNLSNAALSIANIKYMIQGNYFEISPDAQPYLHYWSLSVEEQYYILYPLLLALLFKYARKHQITLLSLGAVASLGLCALLTIRKPVWAFYLLPTRAWELLAGCILAIYSNNKPISSRKWLRWASLIGLLLIGISFALIHEGANFPGIWAVLPVLGAVAVLLPVGANTSTGERWLQTPALVLVGRLSYSLYLWHWPVFSLVDYSLFLESGAYRFALKVILSVVLTALSFWCIENPARIRLNRRSNRPLAYGALLVVLAICVPLGVWVRRANYINARPADVAAGGLEFGGTAGSSLVVLMGDSHGSMYGTALKSACRELGYRLVVISVNAEDPLPFSDGRPNKLWTQSLSVIQSRHPDVVVLACAWNSKLRGDHQRINIAVEALSPLTKRLIILNQPPVLASNANRESIRQGARPPFHEDDHFGPERREVDEYLKQFARGNCSVLDVAAFFEGPEGEVHYLNAEGRQLYHDRGHLSGYGTDLLHPLLLRAIANP